MPAKLANSINTKSEWMAAAEQRCTERGHKLTPKRYRLLETLLCRGVPVSAYDLLEAFGKDHAETIPIMTVYRMLDVFIEAGLVHKLRSTNTFVACAHLTNTTSPHASRFLICDCCGKVQELKIPDAEVESLEKKAQCIGFQLTQQQLELHGLCDDCQGECADGIRP